MKKTYHKLVRDNIPEILTKKGIKHQCHFATPQEFKSVLMKKLREEVKEFTDKPSLEELADILEVILQLSREIGGSPEMLEATRLSKELERGRFFRKIILDWTEEK